MKHNSINNQWKDTKFYKKKNFADSVLYMSLLFMNILATCKNAMYHCDMTGLDFLKSFKEIENCEVF